MPMVLGDIQIKVTADTSDADSKLSATGEKVESFAAKTNQATSTTADFGKASATMAAGAAGIALGLADSVMAAGDFQATVNEIGAVSGATASELTQLSDMALKVGKDTAFSAQEGAQAISELSKAGVSVPDILNGAAMATANLAAAAGTDMPRAAEIMSNAMNMFKISGEDSARVADVLAAGANTSAASINDLALGFSQAGPSAVALGLSLEDVTAALALFADRGLSGSDAGTSLKTMLASLTPATKPAKEAFAELGLVTEESGNAFFDAQGNFVGMEQASVILYDALKDLTDQQRAQALETIFGSDASRAAELMFQAQKSAAEGTGKGYEDYRKAVEASGQATDVAEAKMKGMNGAIEALKGSIETAQIVIGTTFVGAVEAAADILSNIVNIFLNLPGPVQTAIAGIAAGAAAFLAVGSAVGFMIGPLGAATAALAPVAVGIAAILIPLGLLVAGFVALKQAYDQNLGGLADAVNQAAADITSALQPVSDVIRDVAKAFEKGGLGAAIQTFIADLPRLADALGSVGRIIADLAAQAIPALVNAFKSVDWSAVGDAVGTGIQTALSALSNFGAWVLNALTGGAGGGGGAGSFVGEISQWIADRFSEIDWGQLGGALLSGAQRAAALLLDFGQWGLDRLGELGQWLLNAFNTIDWAAIGATLYAGIQSASTALQTWVQEQSDKLATAFNTIDWSSVATSIGNGIANAVTALGDFAGFLSGKGAELLAGLVQGISDHLPDVAAKLGEIATGASAVLPDALTLLLQKGADLIAGLVQGIGDHLPDIGLKLGEIATGAAAVLPDALTLLLQKGADLIAGLVQGIGDHLPDVATKLGELATSATGVLPDALTLLVQKGADLVAGLVQGIGDHLPDIGTKLGEIATSIGDVLPDAVTLLASKGSDLMTGLLQGITDKWPDVDAWLGNVAQDAADTVGDLADTLVSRGTDLIGGLFQGINDKWPEVDSWLGNLAQDAADTVGDLGQTLAEHGTALITGLSTAAQELWDGTVAPWLTSLGQLAVTAVGDLAQTLWSQGQQLLDGLRTGALDIWNNQLGPWLQSLPGMIVSAVGDLTGVLFSAGQDLVQGLVNGIGSMKDTAIGSIQDTAGGIKDAFLGAIHAGSPSKDFYQYGLWIVQGLINGIAEKGGAAVDLMRQIAEELKARFEGEARGFKESGKKAGKSVVDGMNDATGDISDYEVGSAEWRQALQAKITAGMDKVGKKLGDDVNTGVKSKKADHKKAMGEFLDAGVNYGLDKADDATDIGVKAANAMRQGLTSGQQDLVTTAGKIATQVIDEFGSHLQEMYDIGKNYVEGFALGMRAGAGDVEDAANDIGKSAEKELRKATESQSPSKAAFRVGQDVGRGFADGISSTEDLSRKAARKLWRAAWKELKDNIKEGGFLGRDWAVEFWQGMLNAPDMTGPLAAWITDQMVAAADTALKKIQAQIAGITAQLEIARGLVDAPSSIPEVPQPEPVDTTQRDLLQAQLDATKELTAAIEKAFTSAFDAAHKAHVAFVKGQISESEYQAKLQIAQNAYAQKQMNAAQVASLEAQVKAAQAAIDAETAARQKAYEQAVKEREAAVKAEQAAREQAVKQLEQAQRDAQMQMTQAVIDESTQRINQYEKELRKATDPKERAELKAKIALERERIDVANQLATALNNANAAGDDLAALAIANAQIEMLTQKLEALGQVDVGGMLQGIADAMLEAANKIAQAADKMKNAFRGGGKSKGEKDKGGATQDASDPSLGGGMGAAADGGGVSQEFDKIGKAARKAGDDVNAGMGVADMAIRKVLGTTLPAYVKGMGDAGTKGGEALGKNASVAIEHGEANMSKTIVKSVEGATLNGVKIGADRGKEIGVTVTTNMETGVKSREREVTKTVDGVVKDSTGAAVPTAEQGGTKIGDGFITFTSRSITQGQSKVAGDAKQMMTHVGQESQQQAQRSGKSVGDDFSKFTAQGVKQGEGNVRRAGKQIMDGAGQEAKRDANRLGKAAGDDLGRGVAEGIRGRINDVRQAAKDLADAANSGGGGGGGNGGGGGGNGGGGKGGGSGKNRDAVIEAQQLGTRVGDAMGSGVANGVAAQTRSAQQAATNLVQATNDAARKAAQAHSPSKLFMRLGNDIGDGLVIGLHDRTGDAQEAAQALIYTPKGLPGGGSGNNGSGTGQGKGSAPTTIVREYHFHGDIHVPNARVFEEIVDRKTRMNNVAASRGQ